MPNIFERAGTALKHAWTVFNGRDRPPDTRDYGPSYSYRPDRQRLRRYADKTLINAVYNRIALDVMSIDIHHVKVDENGRYREIIHDGLENVMNVEANIDQNHLAYMQDVILSMFDEGAVAEVPVECDLNPNLTSGFDILSMRTAKILEWMPQHIRVRLYNERVGHDEEVVIPKKNCAIHENPFYAVMNEPMGVLQRLLRKMAILDLVNENNVNSKMNMILQLPYVVKSDTQRQIANKRLGQLEEQLVDSKYGIAWTDGTEKIIQLNRPLENNLLAQIEYYTDLFYSQLGITAEIMNGTANEQAMLNYYNRTIEPLVSAIAAERKRKFLSKKARTIGESIMYFRDPFKLTPASHLADIADKLTRNAILTSNEMRAILGYKPIDSPIADELSNKNMPVQDQEQGNDVTPMDQNGSLEENNYGYEET